MRYLERLVLTATIVMLGLGAAGCPDDEPGGAPGDAAIEASTDEGAIADAAGDEDMGTTSPDVPTDVSAPTDALEDTTIGDAGPEDATEPSDAGPDTAVDPVGQLTGTIRVDHFGWRPSASKHAVVLGHPNETLELRRSSDGEVVATYTTSAAQSDEDSGDQYSTVDFSAFQTVGRYYFYLSSADERSYPFEIAADVYDIVGAVAMKSFYYQRCNEARELPHAGDALGDHAGHGGQWVDGMCHTTDLACPAGPGSPDHGMLELHGGWHDAGDYQKTLWDRGVDAMLWAYEVNPTAWTDGQLNIPESGNGIPDILDELMWELDFYLRMQRPDGHFMTSVKGNGSTVASPPSASDEARVYFDTTSPSGSGWSGGGVTSEAATGNAVLSLAHAEIVLRSIGEDATADLYRVAALDGWAWLDVATPANDAERRLKAAAAAAVYRMDSSQTSAQTHVEGFAWGTYDGLLPWSVTPGQRTISAGAWHILANPAADATLVSTVQDGVGQAIVDRAFAEAGVYGGLYGGPGNGWDWSWGSNRAQSYYGAHLLMAAHFGILSDHTEQEVRARASSYLHYMLGSNPLNMVYLTNMAAYGGEHSSFQVYHSWFSYTGGDGDNGNATYNGKPVGVDEPLYPYYPDDSQTSTYGPAPGLVPGGPNAGYGGTYTIPNSSFPAYAYRDWSVGCDWDGAQCTSASWEITEPMAAYQGPFVLLVSFMMSAAP